MIWAAANKAAALLIDDLLPQIPPHHMGKILNLPDIGKILPEDPPFRPQILLFPRKHPQDRDSAVSKLSHLVGGILDRVVAEIGRRVLAVGAVDDDVVGSAIA